MPEAGGQLASTEGGNFEPWTLVFHFIYAADGLVVAVAADFGLAVL